MALTVLLLLLTAPAAASFSLEISDTGGMLMRKTRNSKERPNLEDLHTEDKIENEGPEHKGTSDLAALSDVVGSVECDSALRVVIPGYGDIKRRNVIANGIAWLRSSVTVPFRCQIFVYNASSMLNMDFTPCVPVEHVGYWMSHLATLRGSPGCNGEQVLLWLADSVMPMPNVNLQIMLQVMHTMCLDALSLSEDVGPLNKHHAYDVMRSNKTFQVGRLTDFIEFQFLMFNEVSWNCLLGMIDEHGNPLGWGVDSLFGRFCHARMGIMDSMSFAKVIGGAYSYSEANSQWIAYLNQARFKDLAWPDVKYTAYGSLGAADPAQPSPYECAIPVSERLWCWFEATHPIRRVLYNGEDVSRLIYGTTPQYIYLRTLPYEKRLGITIDSNTSRFSIYCSNGLSTHSVGWQLMGLIGSVGVTPTPCKLAGGFSSISGAATHCGLLGGEGFVELQINISLNQSNS